MIMTKAETRKIIYGIPKEIELTETGRCRRDVGRFGSVCQEAKLTGRECYKDDHALKDDLVHKDDLTHKDDLSHKDDFAHKDDLCS